MDPAKVDGLARVLHRAARTRQIVVFTHDDRLPEAIRRLRLDATMLHVDRRAHSTVDVQISRSPVQRYLDGARGYAKPDRLPPEVQARVVPMFCRSAVEAAAANIVRRRAVEQGTSLDAADEQLDEARTLRETLALVLFGEAGRQGEVATEIRKRYGTTSAALVTELNQGSHGDGARPADAQAPAREHARLHPPADAMNVADVLDEAQRQLDEFDPATSGAWPHAAAVLIRQSLESTLNAFWRTRAPGMQETSWRDRWQCLPAYLGDRPQAREADFAWTALSQACHHRAYEVGLTQEELRGHLATAREFLDTVREAVA